jgi:hypothetical protein
MTKVPVSAQVALLKILWEKYQIRISADVLVAVIHALEEYVEN